MAIPGGTASAAGAAAALISRQGRVKRTYYPVVVLRLRVRLEDFTNEDGVHAAQESLPAASPAAVAAELARRAESEEAVLAALGDVDIERETAARAASAQASTPKTAAAAPPDNVPPDDLSITLAVVPLDCKVELNGFRIADKLTASFSLVDLPITPEIVRAMLVEAYFGTASASDFGDPRRWIPSLLGSQAPTFRGYADVEDMEVGDDFKITISARSMEARLIDAKVHPMTKERRIRKGGEPVTGFLRRFIATVPEFSGKGGSDTIGVRCFPNFDPAAEPVLSSKMFLRSLQSAQSRAQAGGQVQAGPVDPQGVAGAAQEGLGSPIMPSATPGSFSAWDVVVRAAELVGMLPVYDPSIIVRDPVSGELVRGADNIFLIPPQTLKETPQEGLTIPGGPVDGFSRQITIGGAGAPLRTQVRFLVWGSNIKKLKASRKFGRVKAPAIRVVCYDPDGAPGGRVLSAQFPKTPRGTLASPAGTGRGQLSKGHQPTTEIVTKVVRGIRDQRLLEQIAVGLYHAISRHELTCAIETDEMASYIDPTMPETHNENPDLLRLRPGTPVRVTVARHVVDPAAGDMAVDALSTLFERRFNPAFLRKSLLGGSGAVAFASDQGRAQLERALAKVEAAYGLAKLTDWFYVKVVNLTWSADDGFSLSTEVANYVEARNLPSNLSAGDAATNDARKLVKTGRAKKTNPRQDAADANREDILERAATGDQ